jgi:hypothetical protein
MTQTKSSDKPAKAPARDAAGKGELRNEGEGSRSGARHYDEGATRTASDPKKVERLAKEAAKAMDGPEGKKLREAEERGKKADHR